MSRLALMTEVLQEREHQEDLVLQGRFKYTAAAPQVTGAERLAILLEEVGELAECYLASERMASDEAELVQLAVNLGDAARVLLNTHLVANDNPHRVRTPGELRKEAVQVAAVALAILEAASAG